MVTPPAGFAQEFGRLPGDTLRALARALTAAARAGGLALARPEGDLDIPLTLTPEVATPAQLRARARDAAALLAAALRTARAVLAEGRDSARARRVFGRVQGLAREGLRAGDPERIAIARVDWLVDEEGRHRALELNVTIPAMEAYADAAARAWIEQVGAFAGLAPQRLETLVEANGCIAEELRRSLVAHARALGAPERPSIALVHRPDDPQQRELEALAAHFSRRGNRARPVLAGRIEPGAHGGAIADGERCDVLYRHVFAGRIVPGSGLERVAREPARHRLLNPINEPLEAKGLLAELSRCAAEPGAGPPYGDEEREAVARTLPWTRLLVAGAAAGPDGAVADLPARVAAEPESFVLKRSADYGGRSVLVGPEVRAREGAAAWAEAVGRALQDPPGSWVVQQLVRSPRRRHLVARPDGAVEAREVYADASTFTATVAPGGDPGDLPGGCVARFASGAVVNIVGGGGVAPLVRSEVAAEILAALSARPSEVQ